MRRFNPASGRLVRSKKLYASVLSFVLSYIPSISYAIPITAEADAPPPGATAGFFVERTSNLKSVGTADMCSYSAKDGSVEKVKGVEAFIDGEGKPVSATEYRPGKCAIQIETSPGSGKWSEFSGQGVADRDMSLGARAVAGIGFLGSLSFTETIPPDEIPPDVGFGVSGAYWANVASEEPAGEYEVVGAALTFIGQSGNPKKTSFDEISYLELEMRQRAGFLDLSTIDLLAGVTRERGRAVLRYQGFASFFGNNPLWTLALEVNGEDGEASGSFTSAEVLGLDNDKILESVLGIEPGLSISFSGKLFETELEIPANYLYRERFWAYSNFTVPAPTTSALIALGLAGIGWARRKII